MNYNNFDLNKYNKTTTNNDIILANTNEIDINYNNCQRLSMEMKFDIDNANNNNNKIQKNTFPLKTPSLGQIKERDNKDEQEQEKNSAYFRFNYKRLNNNRPYISLTYHWGSTLLVAIAPNVD